MIEIAREAGLALAPPIPATPVAIDGLFGWFSPGLTRRGAVLCGTLGFEQLRAHRSWRKLAEGLAGAGCATLRFDYPGAGDSADPDTLRLADLVGAIVRAVEYLRAQAGVEEVVLVGLRLGGTLAALAARELAVRGTGVDRLVLLAPFATGRAYLRELTLQGRTIDQLVDGTPIPREAGAVSAGGFALGADLATDLASLDIGAAPPAPRILVVGPDAGLAARYAAAGVEASAVPFPHLTQLVSKPSSAGLPPGAFASLIDFAAAGALPRPDLTLARPAPGRVAGPGFTEVPLPFGAGLFGILCRPDGPPRPGPTLIFVSTGLDVHTGYGRRTTRLARELAAAGVSSLRMDVRGVGDSASRTDGVSPIYAPDAPEDVFAALDALAGLGLGPFGVVGNCSGAYLGFHALRGDARLGGAVMVNLYCFAWNPEDDVEAALHNIVRSTSAYAGLLRNGHAWRRLLRGEVRAARILAALARRGAGRAAARLAQFVRSGGEASAARRVAALRRRGARLRFVYGAGEPGLANLHAELGRGSGRLARVIGHAPTILDAADHNLTTPDAHAAFRALLLDFAAELAEDART